MQNTPALNQQHIVKWFIFYKSKNIIILGSITFLYLGTISFHTQNVYIHYTIRYKVK